MPLEVKYQPPGYEDLSSVLLTRGGGLVFLCTALLTPHLETWEAPGAERLQRPLWGDSCGLRAWFRELCFSEDAAEDFPEMSPDAGSPGLRRGI